MEELHAGNNGGKIIYAWMISTRLEPVLGVQALEASGNDKTVHDLRVGDRGGVGGVCGGLAGVTD